jgi:hypothetical protein
MRKYIILVVACLFIGFISGRQTVHVKEKEVAKYVEGKTIRDTITYFVPDTVRLSGEVRYKYKYKTDTIYRDVPVVDREGTLKSTIEDWNLIRDYKRTLFDNESGKLFVDLSVQYNELQKFSYSFTPMHKEITAVKKRVFVPFVSASVYANNSFSVGGGFFYHDIGFRAEYSYGGLNLGILYKF